MSLDADTLFRLLPAIYRIRDDEQGGPLHDLIALFAQELEALEENVDQLYDDQFIETCADWVAPYIGDLIGYRPLHGKEASVATPRADVANTISHRRRKGTILMLEELARDVTTWPARAVEFFEQLATTQYMNHLRPHAVATANLHDVDAMLTRGSAFNRIAHTAEMRRPETAMGRYNIPNVGIFLWRLRPFKLSDIPLTPDADDTTGKRFRVNPLGADLQLFRRPETDSIEHLANPINVPAPLSIREFALQVRQATATTQLIDASDDYGSGKSIALSRSSSIAPLKLFGLPPADKPNERLRVRIADLRDVVDINGNVTWAHEKDISNEQIGLDPERGRVFLGAKRAADHLVSPFVATFHYGFSSPLGGGSYKRSISGADLAQQRRAANSEKLNPHLALLAASGGRLLVADSLVYEETPQIRIDSPTNANQPGHTLVLAADDMVRPVIAASGNIQLALGERSTLVLDGLVITGGPLELADANDTELRTLILRDCTLVPRRALKPDGSPMDPGLPSIVIGHKFTKIIMERCITGPLHIVSDSDVEVELKECIIDANAPDAVAYAGNATGSTGAQLRMEECTVIGKVHTRLLRLASNTLFVSRLIQPTDTWRAPLIVERRQEGCTRFSYLPSGAITPRRHRCVSIDDDASLQPHFTSLRYGHPGYCQLRGVTPQSIRHGADDEGEIGVMHALFQPLREENLRIRLEEYLRFGLHAGIFYAT